jgi:membrane-associated phospholipid phosphatase
MNSRVVAFSAVCLIAIPAAQAEDFTLSDVWSDTTGYFTAPLRWNANNWELFGATAAAVVVAHQFDSTVRNHFAGRTPTLGAKDKNSTTDAIPAAALVAGTFAAGLMLDEKVGRIEAYRMVEAAAFGGITTEVMKFAAGRSRPSESLSANDWRKGGSSFPSLHATAAFAIGTVFAESGPDDYRWVRRVVGYGIAAGTAYARLHDNQHWLSDVVAGSAIGIYSGAFTMNRRQEKHESAVFSLAPTEVGGISLQFTYTLQ